MPFAGYKDFEECVAKNKNKKDPKAYCAVIQRSVEQILTPVSKFKEDSVRMITISFLFDKDNGWTKKKSKTWLSENSKNYYSNIGELTDVAQTVCDFEIMSIASTDGTDEEKPLRIRGLAHLEGITKKGNHIQIAGIDTEEFESNPIMLFNHNVNKAIGVWDKIEKTDDKLIVEGTVTTPDQELRTLISNKTIKALSIYSPFKAVERVCLEKGTCFLSAKESELAEISVVTVPASRGSFFETFNYGYKEIGEMKQNPNTDVNETEVNYMTDEEQAPTGGKEKDEGIKAEFEAKFAELKKELDAEKEAVKKLEAQIQEVDDNTTDLQKAKAKQEIMSLLPDNLEDNDRTKIEKQVDEGVEKMGAEAKDLVLSLLQTIVKDKMQFEAPVVESTEEQVNSEDKMSMELLGKPRKEYIQDTVARLGAKPLGTVTPHTEVK
jgi:HK97 family phage prohead protease